MTVYRITEAFFASDVSGGGAKRFGGRWNSKGVPMLYTSSHVSLSLLEQLVHGQINTARKKYAVVSFRFPDSLPVHELNEKKLPENWNTDESVTQFLGDAFVQTGVKFCMKVPSVIIPEEFNYLINPAHPALKKLDIIGRRDFYPDKRLFPFHVS